MANTTKRPVIDEPPGFSEAWDRLTSGRINAYGGKKQAYAEFYRAGQQSRPDWIEPKPVVPRPTKGSLDAWQFAINSVNDLDCRTCRNYTTKSGGCTSVLRCVDSSSYQRGGVVQIWESAPVSPPPF